MALRKTPSGADPKARPTRTSKSFESGRVSWSHIPCSENRTKTLSPATDFSNCAKHTSILSQSSVTHGSCGSCTATTHLESIVPTTSLVPFPEHDLVVCGDRVDPLGFQSYPQYFNPWQFRDW